MRGQGKAGAQLFERFQRFQPLDGVGGHRFSRRRDQVRVGSMVRAADAAAQLMNLRQAEAVGAIDHDGIGRRHIDAAFDDGRADQHVESTVIKIQHQLFEVALAHLAVTHGDVCFRHQFADRLRRLFDGLDGVVHEINLAAAANFTQCRFPHDGFIPFQHEGLDRQALGGRRGYQRQIAQTAHGHIERPRNRRGGQCQDIDLGAQGLESFLVAHAETMLLIDYHQS